MSSDSIFFSEKIENPSKKDEFSDIKVISRNNRATICTAVREGKTFLLKAASDDSGLLNNLIRREWDISMRCSHPNIAHVYAFEKDTPAGECIIMEYIDGRNLREFLKENPSSKLRKRIMKQLLDAVAYIHSKGIIHNDIKPENIIISRSDNDLKLIDFGLSDDDLHQLGKACGLSPYYCSPELVEAVRGNKVRLDCRSDIFSVGVLINEIFNGRRYSGVAAKCTRKNPEGRFNNIDEIIRSLERLDRLPATLAVSFVILAMSAVIGFQNVKIRELSVPVMQIQEERDEEKADEKAKKDALDIKKAEVDEWVANITESMRQLIQSQGKEQAYIAFFEQYTLFFDKMQRESEPDNWEELRRYLISKMTECRTSLFGE